MIQDQGTPRFLLIGVGPHAKRTYIPHLRGLETDGRAKLVAAVDIQQNKHALTEYQRKVCPEVEFLFVPFFTLDMSLETMLELKLLVARLRISCVIISTEPLAHRAYGLWALSQKLNIIMDKPVTTRRDTVSSFDEAYGIARDYEDLLQGYKDLQRRRTTCFLINSHRRYHPGFNCTLEMIREIKQKTGCPVTNIVTTHCDGQWRLPTEIVEQQYHTYNAGYGKVSHSGYHFIDTLYQYVKAGMGDDKRPDMIEVVTSFIKPNGFHIQLNTNDYKRLFGAERYDAVNKFSDEALKERFQSFGEVDAAIQLTFYREGEAIALAQLNLQHNGFARRNWILPGADLYKGNGRVKHESHEIKSGPFQTIVIDSRQANDKHDRSRPSTTLLGSDNHFEVKVFRNCDMLLEEAPLRVYNVADLDRRYATQESGLFSENVKKGILEEALQFLAGRKAVGELRSNLPDHAVQAYIMSAIYVSHVRRTSGLNPVVPIELSYGSGGLPFLNIASTVFGVGSCGFADSCSDMPCSR